MNTNELKKRLPNASPAFLRLNATDGGQSPSDNRSRVHSVNPKPNGLMPLDDQGAGEETLWYGPARRFEITFVVYSVRPSDYDGWDIKALQDFLVKIGVIPDDGWKTLFGRTRSEKVSTEGEERTEIEIRPC